MPVVMLSDVVEARKGRRRTACSDYVILVKATNSFEVARGSVHEVRVDQRAESTKHMQARGGVQGRSTPRGGGFA